MTYYSQQQGYSFHLHLFSVNLHSFLVKVRGRSRNNPGWVTCQSPRLQSPTFTHFFSFFPSDSNIMGAALLFPFYLSDPSCLSSQPRKKKKKNIYFFFPSWRIFHSWEYILNLASQSISDKHIMFYFKHKMQFWSFHNDTVNRNTANKQKNDYPFNL